MATRSPAKPSPLAILRWLIVLGMFAAGALLFARLPARIPTHWNFAGAPDQFSPKTFGAWLLPGITLLMTLLFPILSKLDPRSENYPAFAHPWEILQTAIVGFMAYMYGITLAAALDPSQSALVGREVVFGIGVLFVIIGNYMGKVRQNFFVGLRTPWTLADPETWNRSQRFGGWAFVLGGLAIIVESILWWRPEWVFFGIVLLIVIVPVVYSYVMFQRNRNTDDTRGLRSFLLLCLICFLIAFGVAVVLRLSGSEDDWICSGGQWVKHGNPAAPQPTVPCP